MITKGGIYALLNICQLLNVEEQNTLVEHLVEDHRKGGHKEMSGNDVYNVAFEAGFIRYKTNNAPEVEEE